MQNFKQYFFETCEFDFFLEMSTVAQNLKQHSDRELVKLLKQKIYIRMGQILPWFVMNPEGQKVKDRYVNFFTNQVLQDPSWKELANQRLNDPVHKTGRWEIPSAEIKDQIANDGVGTFQHMITRANSGVSDYIVAMGSRLASKINNPNYHISQLKQDAEEWHEDMAARERGLPEQEVKTLLTLDHLGKKWTGWKWVDLEAPSCSKEAEAMGHCGNAGYREGDNIVSLRDPEGYAHLTFILNNGYLGESKGRSNNKPSPKYHDPIVELLKTEHIKFIRGGGYMPENNFQYDDLDDKKKEQLAHKKYLNDPVGYAFNVNKGDNDATLKAVNAIFENEEFLDFDGTNFIVERFDNFEEIEDASKNWYKQIENIKWLDEPHDYIDGSYHGYNTSELINKLNKENTDLLNQHFKEEHPEDYEEMELDELIENDDDIQQALEMAATYAQEGAMESEAYESVQKQLNEEDENGFFINFKKHPWELSISKENVKNLYEVFNNDDAIGEDISSVIAIDYSAPYYGYDGYNKFDDNYFNEMARENLAEIGIG